MILVIDNYDSFTYNLVDMIRARGAAVEVVRNDAIGIEDIAARAPEALVLSPGPGAPDAAGITLEAIRAFAGKIPIFGVCLGHQAVAQAFGARIVRAARLMHGKTSRLRHDGKGLFAGVGQGFRAMRYHSLAVERASLPDCLEVTAESEDGEIMGLRHKTLPIETVQYHPESIATESGAIQMSNLVSLATGRRVGLAVSPAVRKTMLGKALEGAAFEEEEMERLFRSIMRGEVGEVELAAFLTALARNPVTPEGLAGAARAMREATTPVALDVDGAVDIVGTGGDGLGTFNISTAAAFVAAGAGVTVAKHGNVAASSRCGSADVLAALGYNLAAGPATLKRSIRDVGVAFLFAKALHPAMRFAASVRRTLGFRTLFNLLGPLTNPAGVRRHVIGVPREAHAEIFSRALARLGAERAMVVSGAGGMDEIAPCGFTFVSSLKDGVVGNSLLDAGAAYGAHYPVSSVVGGDAAENARLMLSVLDGSERGALRAASVENAAAAILVAGKADDYAQALDLARESIDSRRALGKLEKMVEVSK
jgi:anthranilate phosphoribosyltransferase